VVSIEASLIYIITMGIRYEKNKYLGICETGQTGLLLLGFYFFVCLTNYYMLSYF